jgi:hypothetical protein
MAVKRKPTATSHRPAKRTRGSGNEPPEDLRNGQSVRDRAEPYRLATARFLVDDLNPTWVDGRNRKPDKKQVSALCAIFEGQQLQRESVENRLRVLCSRSDVEQMLAHLGDEPATETSSSWPWFGDWIMVTGCRAELMAGQHRVAALKAFFQKKDRLHTTSEPDPLWWLCDVYDRGGCPLLRPCLDDAD